MRIYLKLKDQASPQLGWISSEWEAASVSAEVAWGFKRQAPKGEKEDNERSSDRSMRGAIPDKRGKKEEVSNQATNSLIIQHLELSTVRIN